MNSTRPKAAETRVRPPGDIAFVDARMKRIAMILAAVVVVGAALAWALSAPRPRYSAEEWRKLGLAGDAAAGRLVFLAGGCESCHKSPGQDDPLKLGGGLELKTPFGSFYPPNISTDPVDGIGAWRPVDIANALLSGVSPEGRHFYPAFPFASYQRMTPRDVADLAAFLHTLPAVKGKAPANALPFPFSIRRAVGLWKRLYFDNAGLPPDPAQSEQWNRGRYLVEGPGHCGECHTPRGFLGEMDVSRALAGAPLPDGHGKAANLRGGDFLNWSNADIVEALTSGFTPSGDVLGAGMTAVVRNLAELPESDRQAIAVYLKSLPPPSPPAPTKS
jgi:mono/diheme cytochrome c family protein